MKKTEDIQQKVVNITYVNGVLFGLKMAIKYYGRDKKNFVSKATEIRRKLLFTGKPEELTNVEVWQIAEDFAVERSAK